MKNLTSFPVKIAAICIAFGLASIPVSTVPVLAAPGVISQKSAEKQEFLGELVATCYYDGSKVILNWSATTYGSKVSLITGTVQFLGEVKYIGGVPSGLHIPGGLKKAFGQVEFDAGPGIEPGLLFIEFTNQRMRTLLGEEGFFPDSFLGCTDARGYDGPR